jgi:hypothetical protein
MLIMRSTEQGYLLAILDVKVTLSHCFHHHALNAYLAYDLNRFSTLLLCPKYSTNHSLRFLLEVLEK